MHFELADVNKLPYADCSFDVTFAHNVLEHVSDPLRALKEMRRVLKPGGLVGVRDPDLSTGFFVPSSPLLEEATRLAPASTRGTTAAARTTLATSADYCQRLGMLAQKALHLLSVKAMLTPFVPSQTY